MSRWRAAGVIAIVALVGVLAAAVTQLPGIGAGALLHPQKKAVSAAPPAGCVDETIAGDAVELRAWRCRASGTPRGTVVYLHGVADARTSALGAIARYTARGFDVIAFDSRAHGQSSGDACTYGFYEKRDLARVLDRARPGPIVLVGVSLGAAVALQAAADDPRVSAVLAAETFADLESIARDRAPWVIRAGSFGRALRRAERQARFVVADVSPVRAAARLAVPVFLVHGDADHDTRPDHSQRVFEALHGPRRLVRVSGAGHGQSLTAAVWDEADAWLADHVPSLSDSHGRYTAAP
jgi:pimeloyl-ACP methyl ester carboxylesterase